MSPTVRIAVDAFGGDFGPRVTVPAALSALAADPQLAITLVGDSASIQAFLPQGKHPNIDILHAPDVVTMDEPPAQVLRHKQSSSMWLAVDQVRCNQADACVSAGNTGALMAVGRYLLKTFPGVDRPAICKPVPTRLSSGELAHCYLLDLGANINSDADQLLQFALMGAVLASTLENSNEPRVGLLNIGEESLKGSENIKLAASFMSDNPFLNFIGFVEGDGIFADRADVIVCDGLLGNIALKTSEGAARLMAHQLEAEFTSSLFGRLIGRIARSILLKWRKQFDPARYNGASFLGLQGTLVKSHGGADERAFVSAIQMAKSQAQKQLPQLINQRFGELSRQTMSL